MESSTTEFEPPEGNLFGDARVSTVLSETDLREPHPREDSPSWPPAAFSATWLSPAIGAQLPEENLFGSSPAFDAPATSTDDAFSASSSEQAIDSHEPNPSSLDAELPSWARTATARSARPRRVDSRRVALVVPLLVVAACLGVAVESLGGKSAHHLVRARHRSAGAPIVIRATIPAVQPEPPLGVEPARHAIPTPQPAQPAAHHTRPYQRHARAHKKHHGVGRAPRGRSTRSTRIATRSARIASRPAPSPAPVRPSPPRVSAPASAPDRSAPAAAPAGQQEFNFEQ
jgi:hypothetical protein